MLRQTDLLERKVAELHQKREPGQESHVAIDEFMVIAKGLETYGVDPHPVKVQLPVYLIFPIFKFKLHLITNLGSSGNSALFRNKFFRHQYIYGWKTGTTFSMARNS